MPRAGIEHTSPCILVRSANHYTIRDHHAGNVAVSLLVKYLHLTQMNPHTLNNSTNYKNAIASVVVPEGVVVSTPERSTGKRGFDSHSGHIPIFSDECI